MDVTLLCVAGCPNWLLTDGRLREALTQAGRDPFADPDSPVGLSCRVHRTSDGLAGAPTVEQLAAVLQ